MTPPPSPNYLKYPGLSLREIRLLSKTTHIMPLRLQTIRRSHIPKKYGYDASSYNPLPSQLLDTFMAELLPTIPITLLPGANDPANASYPQQPIHSAMFPKSRTYSALPLAEDAQPGWLDMVTNPWEGEVEGWRVLGTGGQNLDDICRYVDSADRLGMMEAMCRWRCSAPTAPDTLCKLPTSYLSLFWSFY